MLPSSVTPPFFPPDTIHRRTKRSAHLGQVVLLVQQRPPLLTLSHKGTQTCCGEGHRGGLGAGWALLSQPWTLQAAGCTRPAPGAWRGGGGGGVSACSGGCRAQGDGQDRQLGAAGWGLGDRATLPGVRAQRALQEGHGSPGQPWVAATQQDEPFAQAFLHVSCALAAHWVLGTQPARERGRRLKSQGGLRSSSPSPASLDPTPASTPPAPPPASVTR